MGSHKVKKCEICGQIYDDNSTICLGLFCRHNELVEVYVENSGPSVSDANKSKKCPKCGKLYDAKSSICLGLLCARIKLIDFREKETDKFNETTNNKEENAGDVSYED